MKKNILIVALLIAVNSCLWAQPQQLPNSKIYWEIVTENGDSVLKVTGEGRMPIGGKPWCNTGIKRAYIGEGITSISLFKRCRQLTSVKLPQSLRHIYQDAFSYDTSLRQIHFPDALDTIERFAFYDTRIADTLHLPKHLKHIGINAFTFASITHVELPYLIDSIQNAFSTCYYLRSIVLPAGLKHLFGTFAYDTIRHIVNLSTQPQTFEYDISDSRHTFSKTNRPQCRLIVPTSAVETYKNTPVWQDFIIEGGGLSVGVRFNDKRKGYLEGLENRLYKKGEKVSLQVIPRGQYSFSGWKSPDGKVISTANPLVFTVTQDTMLTACFDGDVSVTEAEPSIRAGENIILYPNPTGNRFSVRSDAAVKELTLYDLSGRQLMQKENTDEMDISTLPQGIYFVRVRTGKGNCMKKLVKE